MKIGIVVPYSWSFWGGVQEHADHQARGLRALGHDARILCGNDPAGTFTRVLHPRAGRHDRRLQDGPARVDGLGDRGSLLQLQLTQARDVLQDRHGRHHRGGNDGATDEEEEESAPEPAPQRPEVTRQIHVLGVRRPRGPPRS